MDGCILGLILFLAVVLYLTLGLRAKAEQSTPPPERHVGGRSLDPAVTYRAVMGVVDEVQGRWLGGRYGDEVVHLHLPGRAEMTRHDSDLRRSLRWLEEEAGAVDVVLHYEGEPAVDRRVRWDKLERSADGSIRRAEWRSKVPRMGHKEAGCLPLLALALIFLLVGVLVW
ncbi:hypothetical protein ATHL_02391 [Anaerolinea thermolimosa]|uniref:hypothetical protein n=1 Tax=Anaerolinea thermolimosa TaxID=229919 RepID=UPI0007830C61|nr:hypothetical protein [Anaerolinea thermolimosa]GAP07508.1 hypothetical protein ATHL_02391 [Anaerolinea thermolimosa]